MIVAVVPKNGGSSRIDGDAPLLLLDHKIHGSSAVVHLAHLVVDARIIQDTLGRSGLTRINVRHNSNVPDIL